MSDDQWHKQFWLYFCLQTLNQHKFLWFVTARLLAIFRNYISTLRLLVFPCWILSFTFIYLKEKTFLCQTWQGKNFYVTTSLLKTKHWIFFKSLFCRIWNNLRVCAEWSHQSNFWFVLATLKLDILVDNACFLVWLPQYHQLHLYLACQVLGASRWPSQHFGICRGESSHSSSSWCHLLYSVQW